jgi:hypothetical protein
VWRIVVAAEKIKGKFVHVMLYCNNNFVHISLCWVISHHVILNDNAQVRFEYWFLDTYEHSLIFEVIMSMTMKITVIWDVTSCSLV